MQRVFWEDMYAWNVGYNQVGEVNNIIIMYPQATTRQSAGNGNGCWDWWGYTNSDYDGYTGCFLISTLHVLKLLQKMRFKCCYKSQQLTMGMTSDGLLCVI